MMLASMSSGGHTSQSLEDKLSALKYFISGQGISFIVIKATTSELIGPKKKHLNYLLSMSNQPNVSIPSMVKNLVARARQPEWPVAFKSLITMHHLMTYGHENFLQNVASSVVNSTAIENLCSFVDQTTTMAYNMSIFLRRYARYINAKIQSYRALGHDYCRASANIRMRHIDLGHLLKILPNIQDQFDTLLSFDASLDDLCNGIINSAFCMIYKDFIKLYLVYQAAVIRLLELFFQSDNLKEAKEMHSFYKKFLVRMDKVSDFMPVIDSVGLDKSSIPNLSRIPDVPLTMFEKHLAQLESIYARPYDYSLGRLEYKTLGRPRRRSIKTPSRQSTVIDLLSPMAAKNFRRRNAELQRLDRMVSLGSCEESSRNNDGYSNSNGVGAQESVGETRNIYEELGDIYPTAPSIRSEQAQQLDILSNGFHAVETKVPEVDLITLPQTTGSITHSDQLLKTNQPPDDNSASGLVTYEDDNEDSDALTSWVKV